MPSSITRICLFAIAIAAITAFGQEAPQAKPGLLKPDDVHATLVTLHAHKLPINDVIDQLSQQSGMHITLNGSTSDTVTLDADAKPFWEVLSDVCDQTHVGVPFNYGYGFSAGIPLMPGMDTPQRRRVIAGPVLLMFNRIGRVSVMTAAPAIRDFCDIGTSVVWEPRLAVAYVESSSKPTIAVDENGLSLVPTQDVVNPRNPSAEKYQSPAANGTIAFFTDHSIHLKIPPQAGRRLARLSGQIRLWVIDKTETVEIGGLAAAGKARRALTVSEAQQLKIQNIWLNDDQAQIQLSAARLKDESDEQWQQRRSRLSAMHGKILDADGNVWSQSNDRAYGQGGGGDSLTSYLQFQRADGVKSAPVKLVMQVPVSAAEIDVPYELKDLPLP
jgi:hypothetical protein